MFLQIFNGFPLGPVIGIVLEISYPRLPLLPVNKPHGLHGLPPSLLSIILTLDFWEQTPNCPFEFWRDSALGGLLNKRQTDVQEKTAGKGQRCSADSRCCGILFRHRTISQALERPGRECDPIDIQVRPMTGVSEK